MARAVADVSCQTQGSPWSMIAVRVRAPFDPRLHECERAMRLRVGSSSVRNSPYLGSKPKKSSTWSQRDEQVRKDARASSSGSCPPGPQPCIVRPSHLRASQVSPDLRGLTRGWWKSSAVSTQYGCASCRACRSDSNEWPSRIVKGFMSVRNVSARR